VLLSAAAGGCDPAGAIEGAVRAARKSILIQAYEITPGPLVAALVAAHRRGVDVRAIVDYRQLTDRRNHDDAIAVEHLGGAGIPVLVDRPPGLMHDKVMIIDGEIVVTGSFNYTYSAEHRNVENLLVIRHPALAAQYVPHWRSRAAESRPLRVSAGETDDRGSQSSAGSDTDAALPALPDRLSAIAAPASTNGRDARTTTRSRRQTASNSQARQRPSRPAAAPPATADRFTTSKTSLSSKERFADRPVSS
jgi:hypothetical protein